MLHAYGTDAHPGFFYSIAEGHNDAHLLACQVLAILFIFGWTLVRCEHVFLPSANGQYLSYSISLFLLCVSSQVTMLPFFLWLNFMGWFRCESVQELVGLDITYNLGTEEGGPATPYGDDVKEEYLDAYERYRENMRNMRSKGGVGTDTEDS